MLFLFFEELWLPQAHKVDILNE